MWIDLLVPFRGNYQEADAWNDAEAQKYVRYLRKRQAMESVEAENIQALMDARF